MREWPKQHKNVATLILLMVFLSIAAYWFLIRPKSREVAAAKANLQQLENDLAKTDWPLDSSRLTKLLDDYRKRLEGARAGQGDDLRSATGIKNKAEFLLQNATAMFDPKIRRFFSTPQDFMTEVSRLDYQEEFNQLTQRLNERKIAVAEEVLGLDENTSSPYTYQLLLQVWTVDVVTQLVFDHDLQFVKDASVKVATETGDKQAAKITVLPVRGYILNKEDSDPYLLEFPVRISIRGKLENVLSFMQSLHADGRFLPISRFEAFTENPNSQRVDATGHVVVEEVEITLECSSFFRPNEKTPVRKVKKNIVLPAGI